MGNFKTDTNGKLIDKVNREFEALIQDDKMILGWFNGSLTPSILSTLACSISSRTTWIALAKRYASPFQNRILQLRSELLCTTRGDLFISDFLDKIKSVADKLVLFISPIGDSNLMSIVMNNIGSMYETTVSST